MEANPNHPVVRTLHDKWHTIVAILIAKHGYAIGGKVNGQVDCELVITAEDIRSMRPDGAVVVVEIDGVIHLKLINKDVAMQLARKEGGLPT